MYQRLIQSNMRNLTFLLIFLFFTSFGFSQLIVTEIDEDAAGEIIAGPGVEIITAGHYGGTNQLGSFSGGLGIIGIESGVVLTTGNVELAGNGNGGPAESIAANGSDFSSQLSAAYPGVPLSDASALQISFEATATVLQFDFVFASEEYLEYVGEEFNDAIGVFIDGPGFSDEFAGYENVALVPGTSDLVNINNVNTGTNATWYVNNPPGGGPYSAVFAYDGFTQKMTILLTGLSCGSTYNLHFAVADAIDENFDAALFIGANSVQSNFAVGEITVVDASPFCEGDEFTASITHNPSWNYTWSTGESGLGVSSVVRTAVFGVDEISVVVADGDGCLAERSAEAIVHTDDNVAPGVMNTTFTYYATANEEICFEIYATDSDNETAALNVVSIDGDFSLLNFIPTAIIPEVYHEIVTFCWTPNEYDYGENSFTISVTDNNSCASLSQNFTFKIIVTCPMCPECIYYEDRTPESNPLPPLTEAAKCIIAGMTDEVIVGDEEVIFRAGEYIELGDFFVEGPFFAEITGETCIEECTNCCESWTGFRYDPLYDAIAPDGDGIADYWFLNDTENPYCAFNATGFEIWVGNHWSRSEAFYYRSQLTDYCCPFQAATEETGLDHTVINWDGTRDDGAHCNDHTYKVVVRLYSCGFVYELKHWVAKLSDELPGRPNFDTTLTVNSETLENNISIYPNPGSENVTISIGRNFLDADTKLILYDLKNAKVLEQTIVNEQSQIDISFLRSGIYIVSCSNTNGVLYTKLIVQ
jgi:hypothetical protein